MMTNNSQKFACYLAAKSKKGSAHAAHTGRGEDWISKEVNIFGGTLSDRLAQKGSGALLGIEC